MTTEQGQARQAWRGMLRRFASLLGAFWFRELLQAGFTIYLARREAATFGQFFLGLSLGQLVLFVCEFGLNQHLAVLLTRNRQAPADLLAQVSLLKAVLLILSLLGLWGFIHWQGYPPGLRLVVLALAAGAGLEALSSSFYAWLQVEGRQAQEGRVRAGAALLGFSHGFAALYLGAAAWVVAGYSLLESLSALAACLGLARRRAGQGRWWPGWADLAGTWGGGLVFTAMAGASILYNRFNIIYLERLAGEEALAQYGVTWQLVEGLTGLVTTLLLKNVMLPRLLKLWGEERPACAALARDAAYWLLLGSLVLGFLLMAWAEPLLNLLYGPAYAPAAALQKWLSLGVVLGVMHNLAGYLMIAMGRQKLLLAYFLVALLFNVPACLVLMPGHPLEGAMAAILLSKALLALLSLGHVRRLLTLGQGRRLARLAAACAGGGVIFLALRPWLGEAAASAPALLPLLWPVRRELAPPKPGRE